MAIQLQRDTPFAPLGWRRLVDAVIQLITGRQNSVGDCTLAVAPATTTFVAFENCSKDCRVFLEAQTLNAAAAVATTRIQSVDITQGGFTITHASSVQNDRTFSFVCIGG
jgi:hypothetical protein